MTMLPKLNRREIARLLEIANGCDPSWRRRIGSNESLLRKKLVAHCLGQDRGSFAVLTDLGRQVLAGFPERTP